MICSSGNGVESCPKGVSLSIVSNEGLFAKGVVVALTKVLTEISVVTHFGELHTYVSFSRLYDKIFELVESDSIS